mmetsp:Transcript_46865/g.60234  ORF Transcript_46865/g.60234 Transcript_46865/m.60234 type:complete len:397 (+) Transcript_46865:21-1211(+)|eukprot:CAMPEP_0114363476 /NCGR_PEP_ID=MMETSP0101-20121206/26632_1 /TAXON_ID=38822 ORGANISM="Pteridomonas danica, Strain PT" /NCGR_SAMPLE_ID=MMETSP0101 /ASSEMBLY_ACC=CAM_ASM_000211 /LENGTH=396 /DNA_ID=CAMNT_0001510211 /DNA_START=8 /DNA_END=1198 /DNA_ORIENTATION=+
MASSLDPVSDLLTKQGFVIIDGGLGTDLESLGHDLSIGGLWSAHFLDKSPEVIAQVHQRFFDAGADVAITSTYQASFDGFEKEGISKDKAIELMKKSIKIAVGARNSWWNNYDQSKGGLRYKPLIAASIGSYGATVNQEYVGNFKSPNHDDVLMTSKELYDWHLERLEVIGNCPEVDILAIETIPSSVEAEALVECLNYLSKKYNSHFPKAWISFSCKDMFHINDGTLLSSVLNEIHSKDTLKTIIGYGVNCTSFNYILQNLNETNHNKEDSHVADDDEQKNKKTKLNDDDKTEGLLTILSKHRHGRQVIVYPNSGESYNENERTWHDDDTTNDTSTSTSSSTSTGKFIDKFAHDVLHWRQYLNDHNASGQLCVGGCCRISPNDITIIRKALEKNI